MQQKLLRIEKVEARPPTGVVVRFRGDKASTSIELAGWIATGGEILAPIRDPRVFAKVGVSDFGAAISWDGGEGDLSIDAVHLKKLADEQKPFSNTDVQIWQAKAGISNAEAASLLKVSLSTWHAYKTSAAVPKTVAMLLRAMRRDPLLLQAHLRPTRPAGRPRKEA
jgi:DNA-binding transcriptional regulator YiaG